MKEWLFPSDRSWAMLLNRYRWLADMVDVQQNPTHHAEGDVAEHTQQVLNALEGLAEYQQLAANEQQILWVSALLHDVEKRSTTRLDMNGQIISPGHAKRGELTSRQILFQEIPTPFAIRERICAMVRYHGLPLWLMDKPEPQKALFLASLRLDTQQLATLAKADIYGRLCSDQSQLLQRIELFQLYCQEQQFWGQGRQFLSAENRFCYFNQRGELTYQPYDEYGSHVIIMSGLPGMGKDSYINQHYSGMANISLDAIRRQHKINPDDKEAQGWVVQQAKQQAKVYLRQHVDFVWNATNITRQMRSQLIELFTAYGAKVTLVYIEVPYQRWINQNRERQYAVPDAVIKRMLSKLEPPTLDEAHQVIYAVDDE